MRAVGFRRLGNSLAKQEILSLSVVPGISGKLLATTELGVVASTNNASTWQPSGFGSNAAPRIFRTDPQLPLVVYAAPADALNQQAQRALPFIRKSMDGGQTWRNLIAPPGAGLIVDVAIDPQDSNYVFACGPGGIYISNDAGEVWQPTPYEGNCRTLVYAQSAGEKRLLGAELSDNGNAPHSIVTSEDNGATWQSIYTTETRVSSIVAAQNSVLVVEANGSLSLSTDGGLRWSTSSLGADTVAIAPSNSAIVYLGTGFSISVSNDFGASFGAAIETSQQVNHLAVDPSNADLLYVGTNEGVAYLPRRRLDFLQPLLGIAAATVLSKCCPTPRLSSIRTSCQWNRDRSES